MSITIQEFIDQNIICCVSTLIYALTKENKLEEAVLEFQTEINRQTTRLSYHVQQFYKWRSEINKLENNLQEITEDI